MEATKEWPQFESSRMLLDQGVMKKGEPCYRNKPMGIILQMYHYYLALWRCYQTKDACVNNSLFCFFLSYIKRASVFRIASSILLGTGGVCDIPPTVVSLLATAIAVESSWIVHEIQNYA